MISYFRRYQRAIYIVITIVIVLSFSFFGTYSSFNKGSFSGDDIVVARLVDGTKVYKSEFDRYLQFLLTNPLSGGEGGKNFLNNGFLETAILGTPFGEELLSAIGGDVQQEWIEKLEKEKKYQAYQHPQAPFVGAQSVWTYFAPDVKENLVRFQSLTKNASFQDIYKDKKNLYLAERAFPSIYLKQVLLYQQKQYSWLEPDVTLETRNMSLFGYNSFEDWFGKRFLTAAILAIMNTAKIAEKEGLSVSYDEAKLEIYGNAKRNFEQFIQGNSSDQNEEQKRAKIEEIINRTLVMYGMEEHDAVEIMRSLLLFQRAVPEIPSHISTTKMPFEQFLTNSNYIAQVTEYFLPQWLQGTTLFDVLQVQCWIDKVSPQSARGKDGLELPVQFLPVDDVIRVAPELVQKRFLVSLKEVNKTALFDKIRIKDIWNWFDVDDNWNQLGEKYPILLERNITNPSDRVRAFDNLSGEIKKSVDSYIRNAIIASHPEWIEDAFIKQKPEMKEIAIRVQGGVVPLEGIHDQTGLLDMLSNAPIADPSMPCIQYTQDKQHFYNITVLDRSQNYEIVPLKIALEDGTLKNSLQKYLKAQYHQLQLQKAGAQFQKENGEYRDFQEVQESLLPIVFQTYIAKLDKLVDIWKKAGLLVVNQETGSSLYPTVRYLPYLDALNKKAQKEGVEALPVVAIQDKEESNSIASYPVSHTNLTPISLTTTWNIEKVVKSIHKKEVMYGDNAKFSQLFEKPSNTVTDLYYDSSVQTPCFALVHEISQGDISGQIFETLKAVSKFLGDEAIQERSSSLIKFMVSQDSLSCDVVSKPISSKKSSG